MNKPTKVWLAAWVIFWFSLIVTFLIDFMGLIETSNLGFVAELWISWIAFTVVLGLTLSFLTRFIVKD